MLLRAWALGSGWPGCEPGFIVHVTLGKQPSFSEPKCLCRGRGRRIALAGNPVDAGLGSEGSPGTLALSPAAVPAFDPGSRR